MTCVLQIPRDGDVAPGSAWSQMERILGFGNINITQSAVSTIAYKIFMPGASSVIQSGTLLKTSVIFDTLQTTSLDAEWTEDAIGYNFKNTWTGVQTPPEGKCYRYVVTITDTSSRAYSFARDRCASNFQSPVP